MRPVKTYEFIVVLKKNTTKLIDIISLLMLSFSIIIFIYEFSIQYVNNQNSLTSKNVLLLIWIFGILGWVFYSYIQQKRGMAPNYRFALLLAAWGWFMHPTAMWMSALFVLAAILEKPIKVSPEYAFDNNEIVFNSFPQKHYLWNEVSNVVLNAGMLTIDFKNNKLIQGEVNDEVTTQVEKEFNTYCKLQLNK